MFIFQVSKKNIMDIIKKLMVHIDKAESQSKNYLSINFLWSFFLRRGWGTDEDTHRKFWEEPLL